MHQEYTYIDEELHMAILLGNRALVELILKNQVRNMYYFLFYSRIAKIG